jgi:uncharacterized protein YgbK (DUF1537 family)
VSTLPLFIVADDLTGAADAALPFWRAGRRAVVVLNPQAAWPAGADVTAICADTRAMSEGEAARVVAAGAARRPAAAGWFKKIDSTLRGWVGAETRAMRQAQPGRRCVFAPSYPSRGRTWEADGVYRVHGVPLADTEFADEVVGLSGDSRLGAFLRRHFGREISELVRASTDAALEAAVASARGPALWVGSSGLALALAGPGARPPALPDAPTRLQALPVIVAVGSRRALAERQVKRLQAALSKSDAAADGVLRVSATAYDPSQALALADELGRRAAAAATRRGGGGLILTGGDIATATLRHLGATAAEVVGEVEDGLPVLRVGSFHVVTKAGGFGDEFSLVRAYQRLSEFLR